MASIQSGAESSGKRAVDHEIPLIPFIDLLLCCVMFLLVTAVWNQLRSMPVSTPGTDMTAPATPHETLEVRVTANSYVIGSTAGLSSELTRAHDPSDRSRLDARLRELRSVVTGRGATVQADDGVEYDELIQVVDALSGAGFQGVVVSSS